MTCIRQIRRWAQRHRAALLTLALLGFLAGLVFALRSFDLSAQDVRFVPLALLTLILMPLSIFYSAVNLRVMARASCARMSFVEAIRASVLAGLAELLPLPGGAIVRSAALSRAGATTARSVELVLAFALLWIAVSAVGAGIALSGINDHGLAVALGGTLCVLALTGWIARRYGTKIAVAALALRLLGLGLTVARVALAMMALSITFDWIDTLAFAFAIVAGTASAIVPAGLGLSEALAALLASAVEVSPAGAFLAVALGRIAGLVVNCMSACAFILIALFRRRMAEFRHA